MKVALFGYGYWGTKIYQQLVDQGLDVVIVEKKSLNTEKLVSQQSVWDDGEILHCFIATPEETHFKLAKSCLLAGKHVFVEKPLCLIRNQARTLVKEAIDNQRLLYVNYIFLHDPALILIKKVLDQHDLGRVTHIDSVRHSQLHRKKDVDVIDDLLIHDLYLLRYFFGNGLENIKSVGQVKRGKRFVQSLVHLEKGKQSLTGYYSWINHTPQREMTLYAQRGKVIWQKTACTDLVEVYSSSILKPKVLASLQVEKTFSPLRATIDAFFKFSQSSNFKSNEIYDQYIADVEMLELAHEKYTAV